MNCIFFILFNLLIYIPFKLGKEAKSSEIVLFAIDLLSVQNA